MTFQDLNLIDPIQQALNEEGYVNPTPIQQQAIPYLLEGRDLLGCAQTGTGKTAAFAIPILQLLHQRRVEGRFQNIIKALILTPTRELAIQIDESFKAYGRHTDLRSMVIFGGVSQHHQVIGLKKGTDVLIATPGRLLDLIGQGYISLQHLQFFVLDEADRMLDMGFVHDVRRVIKHLPPRRQTLFFSATMPKEAQTIADTILTNPAQVTVTPVSSTVEIIEQSIYHVERKDKTKLLKQLLERDVNGQVLVFSRTKHGADKIVKDLQKAEITAAAIHGNKSQPARQRALNDFKSNDIRVLVATDIAARGIDIDELAYVINYDLPEVPETYVHRIGRTGRAGASGSSMSFCDWEERPYLKDIEKLIAKKIPVAQHDFAMSEIAPPAEPKKQQQRGRRPQTHSGSGNAHNSNRSKPRQHSRMG